MELFHGSDKIIEKPIFGHGRLDNDYGRGFYCTKVWDMAAEWAATTELGGFVNSYHIDTDKLSFLDLQSDEFHILHWLSVLLVNRIVRLSSPIEKRAMAFLVKNYSVDTAPYDIIKGYRADDSYFSFVRAFLSNTITIEQLSVTMHLGDLGTQYMLKSQNAFDRMVFTGSVAIDGRVFYSKRLVRDTTARHAYFDLLEKEDADGHTVRDIMKGGLSDDELRIL